ncbi:MAG TPA: hypothetical protein VFB66_00570 [Tepidisphaeraceae bacterium]|nr:hypothetical protein [Tepidisphaeraceae bacterium]
MAKGKKKLSAVAKFLALSDEEKDRVVAEFDKPFIGDTFGPPPPEAIKQLRRARKRGRPKVGSGAVQVSVAVERTLLRRADAFAKRNGLNRSQLVARGLEALMRPTPLPRRKSA